MRITTALSSAEPMSSYAKASTHVIVKEPMIEHCIGSWDPWFEVDDCVLCVCAYQKLWRRIPASEDYFTKIHILLIPERDDVLVAAWATSEHNCVRCACSVLLFCAVSRMLSHFRICFLIRCSSSDFVFSDPSLICRGATAWPCFCR